MTSTWNLNPVAQIENNPRSEPLCYIQ